jgi:hypothetical protein
LEASAVHFADEEDEAADAASGDAMSAGCDVAMAILDTTPTTFAGAIAVRIMSMHSIGEISSSVT